MTARLHRGTQETISSPNKVTADSSDNDSDDFAVEDDGGILDTKNEELGFFFASRRT